MGLTSTRTHTVYWSTEDLASLRLMAEELEGDFEDRRRYIDPRVADRMQDRLQLLKSSVALMGEPAD